MLEAQAISAIKHYGLPVVFALIGLESLGLPLPGEATLIATSGIATTGALDIWAVAVTAIIAAVIGDNIGFLIGRRFGRELIIHHGQRIGITDERFASAERLVKKYGFPVVLLARFFALLRQLNGIVAGATGMAWSKFFLANLIGASLWVGLWTTISYKFSQSALMPMLYHHFALVGGICVIGIVVVGTILWLRRKNGSQLKR